ncbi:MAG: DUF1579 domain-containing protein [Pseudomonadota bacterium]
MDTETEHKETTDMNAMMAVSQKLAIPGAPHQLLASMAGSWDTRTKSWMAPGEPTVESTGTCEQKILLGGRYLHQEFTGDMMGTAFTGFGVTGYDNYKKKYVSIWMDSMSTGIYFFEGTAGEDGKTITQECHYDDPVKGPMKWRSVTKIVNDDTHLFEMYGSDQTGNEEKMMEITYTRRQ